MKEDKVKDVEIRDEETQEKRVLKLRSIDPIVFCKFSGGAVMLF